MPTTLQFGAWSPDQSNDPIQIPDTQGPVTIALADCLNVYFANGSYKSMPSPAPALINAVTAQVLGAPVLNAYSYFDYVEQQQTVFAGTAANVQQLNPDGSWSVIDFLTNTGATLTGQGMSIGTGFFTNTRGLRSNVATFAIGKFQAGVFGLSFVAGAVTFTSPVTGATTTKRGFEASGISTHPIGTCAHPGLLSGTMVALEDFVTNGTTALTITAVSDPTQSAFATIKTNGKTFTSAAASYSYTPSTQQAQWVWSGAFGFAPGSTYSVVLV